MRSALPNTKMSPPSLAFSLETSSATLPLKSFVLFQSALFSVREKTTFSILFMKSAIQPCSDGQIGRHELVGHAAEDQRVGVFLGLTNVVLEFFFEDEPADVPVRTFEEAVDAHHVPYDQFSHRTLLFVHPFVNSRPHPAKRKRMLVICPASRALGLLQPDRLHALLTEAADAVAHEDERDMETPSTSPDSGRREIAAFQRDATKRSSLPRVCSPSSTAPKPFASWNSAAVLNTMPNVTFVAPS